MWPVIVLDVYFVIILTVLLPNVMIEALRYIKLELPPAVPQGANVVLKCSYNLDGDILFSLKWYKGRYEFYRYTPGQNPPIHIFQIPGIKVDPQSSNGTQVTLENVQESASGLYTCEVSADATSFITSLAHEQLEVVEIPDNGPSINGINHSYRIGDILQGNCTIGHSRPAANLTWIFNDQQVFPVNISSGMEASNSFTEIDFVITEENFVGGKMNIKCVAKIHNVYHQSVELDIEELIEGISTTTYRSSSYDKYTEPAYETNMNMTNNQGTRNNLVTFGKTDSNNLSDSLKIYIDEKFKDIKDFMIKENKCILIALATNAALIRNLQEQFNNKKNVKFPIKTTEELEELENEINDENFEHYVTLIKEIIFPHDISQSLNKILDEKLFGSYSYDGDHGKLPFKNFANINKLFARVHIDEGYAKAIRNSFLLYNRENN